METTYLRGFGTIFRQKGSRFLWMQYWHNGQRHRESTVCEKPKAAQEILRQKLLALDRESRHRRSGDRTSPNPTRAADPARLLVRDLYQSLESDYVINRRKSLSNLKIRWDLRLDQAFGDMLIAGVTIDHIKAYIAARQKAKAANATINRDLAALKRCYTLAIETGILKFGERPFFPTLEERNVRKGFVKDKQYVRLASSTGEIGLWLRAMFEVGYTYGWRKEELLTRRVRHADLLERTLGLDPHETKNDDPRTVHMTPRVFELLKQCCAGKNAEDYLFTREKDHLGRKVRSRRIVDFRDDWARACCAAGVGNMLCRACRKTGEKIFVKGKSCPKCEVKCKLTDDSLVYVGLLFHDLRRSGVSNMIRDGVSEKQAMTQSGHRTRAVFDRYHIVDPAQGREIARKMEKGAANRIREARQQELFSQHDMFEEDDPPRKPAASDRQVEPTEVRAGGGRKPS
jgi:integrase